MEDIRLSTDSDDGVKLCNHLSFLRRVMCRCNALLQDLDMLAKANTLLDKLLGGTFQDDV